MAEEDDFHAQKFASIYENGSWGGIATPRSGSGSTFQAALPYVETIQKIISEQRIKVVLDIGHGDWEMWKYYKFENTQYIGIDVYAELTRELEERHGTKTRKFYNLNAATQELPEADICITKDVLQHLTDSDISKILTKMRNFEYLVICNDFYQFKLSDTIRAIRRFASIRERITRIQESKNPFFLKLKRTNSDIEIGSHRCIDLEDKKFANYLSTHKLLSIKDFNGKETKRPHLIKRIYIYKKNDWGVLNDPKK